MENFDIWNHSNDDGIATNRHPTRGGIVDVAIVSGLWFVIPNHPNLDAMEGFNNKVDAIAALNDALKGVKNG